MQVKLPVESGQRGFKRHGIVNELRPRDCVRGLTFGGAVTIDNNLTITKATNVTFNGDVNITGNLIIAEGATLTFNGTLTVNGQVIISKAGAVTFGNAVKVGTSSNSNGNFLIGSSSTLTDVTSVSFGSGASLDYTGIGAIYSGGNIAFAAAQRFQRETEEGIEPGKGAGAAVALFSLEMSADQLATRILAEESGISSENLRMGKISQQEFRELARAAADLENLPLYIDDTPGLTIAALFISHGMYRYVLVVGADTFSKITDWTKRDCVFFGDGAGAVVLSHSTESSFFAAQLGADGTGKDSFAVPWGGKFAMDGAAVYEAVTTILPRTVLSLLKANNMTAQDIDCIVPHQPGIRVLRKTAEKLGIQFSLMRTNMERFGNTAGATVPLLLHDLNRTNQLHAGDMLLLVAIGAGWADGGVLLRWTKDDTYYRG
jgi:hypothetical protein